MSVIIGVDPHKATHTAVAIDRSETEVARARVRATRTQVPQLMRWAEPLGERAWAIESAGGLGYLLSQQLVAAGETVLDPQTADGARPGRNRDVHDLRHVGNDLRSPGASLRDLMAHMGHSTQNAELVYQHVDVQRQREMAARLSKAIERAVWPTSGPGRSNAGRKAKRSARPQGL